MRAERINGVGVEVHESVDGMVESAAGKLFTRLRRKSGSVIGLATGSTFIPFYKHVSACFRDEGVSFAEVKTFNLDEYYPIQAGSPDSYHSYMWRELFSNIDIREENAHLPDGSSQDPEAESARYERSIADSGGIDLQFLGLGGNGHIGFNEPGTPFSSRTHLTRLTQSTVDANRPLFSDPSNMPGSALTMGIGTIMDSSEIVLLAFGKGKAAAVAASLKGAVTEEVPASCLRRHGGAHFIIDEAAASEL